MKTIILCGGGTAGHIMPNIALVPALSRFKVVYLGVKNSMEEEICKQNNVEFVPIEAVKFSRTDLFKNLSIPFLLPKCINNCKNVLERLSPNVVFSKGGFASLPVTLASKRLNIPYVIHESDYTMGLANKLVAKSAKVVMTNFKSAYNGKNAMQVGIPLRATLFSPKTSSSILESLSLPLRPTLLATGGSAGASKINDLIFQNLDKLTQKYNVIHLTGKGKGKDIKKHGYLSLEFAQNMGELYKCSDVVVSRAGATAIAEIKALGKRAILIPLSKKASRGDQIKNAHAVKSDHIVVIEEENLTNKLLLSTIEDLLKKDINTGEKSGLSVYEIADVLYKISL